MLNVNHKAIIEHTRRLENVHKYAFPSAVRNTLNEMAYRHKLNVPETARKKFITRNKSFFKAATVYRKARGNKVNKMMSVSGLNASKPRFQKVSEGLEAQEFGGRKKYNKTYAHDDARTSKQRVKKVAGRNKYQKHGKFHDATKTFKNRMKGRGNSGYAFMAAIGSTIKHNKNEFLIKQRDGKTGLIYRIDNVSHSIKRRKLKVKVTKLYRWKNTKMNKFKKHGYLEDAKDIVVQETNKIYKEKAEYQLKKYWK